MARIMATMLAAVGCVAGEVVYAVVSVVLLLVVSAGTGRAGGLVEVDHVHSAEHAQE